MTLDKFINVLVPLTLIEMMIAVGLSVSFFHAVKILANRRVVFATLVASYVFVPAATVALLLLFHPHPMVSAGFLILAVCPGAPFGPPVTALAKGDVTASAGLMVLLCVSSAIAAPLLLAALLPLLSANGAGGIDMRNLIVTLFVTQLLPLSAGLAFGSRYPKLAAKLKTPANRISAVLNLSCVVLILYAQFPSLMAIRLRGIFGMLVLLAITFIIGWLAARIAGGDRKSIVMATSLRNVGVGLVIANSSFRDTPALNAVIAFGLLGVFGSLLLAIAWSRMKETGNLPHETPAAPAAL